MGSLQCVSSFKLGHQLWSSLQRGIYCDTLLELCVKDGIPQGKDKKPFSIYTQIRCHISKRIHSIMFFWHLGPVKLQFVEISLIKSLKHGLHPERISRKPKKFTFLANLYSHCNPKIQCLPYTGKWWPKSNQK